MVLIAVVNSSSAPLVDLLSDLIKQGLVSNLIKSLSRNTVALQKEFKFEDDISKRDTLEKLMNEQIQILKILFSLANNQDLSEG